MSLEELKKTICDVAHELWRLSLVDFSDANLSIYRGYHDSQNEIIRILATVTSKHKKNLSEDDVSLFDEKGDYCDPDLQRKKPTKDLPIHVQIYMDTDYKAQAVLHSHGFYAMKYAAQYAGKGLEQALGLKLIEGAYQSVDQARLGMVSVTEPACSGENRRSKIVRQVHRYTDLSRAILVPTCGSYIYSKIQDPIAAMWNCLDAAISLEKWAKDQLEGTPVKFDGDKIFRDTYKMYKNAPIGELPLFEQMKKLDT